MAAAVGIGSAAAFALAALLLGAFFATSDRRLDRLAEWCFVVFAALAVALAVLVQQRLGPVSEVAIFVTAIGIAGVILVGLLELLSTLGRIDFQRYGVFGAIGFAGWLAWIAGVSVMALATATLPVALGWLGLATVAAGLVVVGRFAADRGLIRGERSPGLGEMAPLFGVFLAIVAWVVWLGVSL